MITANVERIWGKEEHSGDFVFLSDLGEKDSYKESLVAFLECAWNIDEDNVEEIFLQNYKEQNNEPDESETLDLATAIMK